jgi:tetrapyrrole methylase family protein/MazG family protein
VPVVPLPRVVVIGLGPAGSELAPVAALDAIAAIPTRFLRTARHPSASILEGAPTFDRLYETADTFADVYGAIADELVAAAEAEGTVLYAVPGSPFVLERSVRHLLADPRVAVTVIPALSFLDLAYGRLGIDPVEAGIRLVDGHEFAIAAAGERGPLLVAHAHARSVLSEIKLAVDDVRGDVREPSIDGAPALEVVILQRLGLPDEEVTTVPWSELDRSVEPDHLTCLYIPRLAAPVGQELVRFHDVVRRLREECPWDRVQTHDSLTRYAIEEVYELVEAIGGRTDSADPDEAIEEELGDVLLQVFLHSAIAEQEGRFTVADVAAGITEKMVRRHPHVFGTVEVSGAEQVVRNWEEIKAAEKGLEPAGGAVATFASVPGDLPALAYARELSSRASKAGFDWEDGVGALEKVAEELDEVRDAFAEPDEPGGRSALRSELGDLLFAIVNVARHRGVDPESALRTAAAKFRRRVEQCQALAAERGIDTRTAGLEALDALWDEVKAAERA